MARYSCRVELFPPFKIGERVVTARDIAVVDVKSNERFCLLAGSYATLVDFDGLNNGRRVCVALGQLPDRYVEGWAPLGAVRPALQR